MSKKKFIVKAGYLTQKERDHNAKLIWAHMLHKKWSKQATAALLGNIDAESAMNPGLSEVGGGTTAAGPGFGFVQWTPKSNLVNRARANGWDYRDPYRQLDVIDYEMKKGIQWIGVGAYSGMSFRQFSRSTKSPTVLADAFIKCYERPANNNQPQRGVVAERYYRMFKNVGPDGSGSVGSGGFGDEYRTFSQDHIKKNSATRPGLKLTKPKGIVIHTIPGGAKAKAFRNTLNAGNSGIKKGYHILVDSEDTINVVPFDEMVYHAEGSPNISSKFKSPDRETISIAVEANRSTGMIPDKAMSKLIAVCAEIGTEFEIRTDHMMHNYLVSGIPDPKSWVSNQFLYSNFISLVEAVKKEGGDIILNPDFEEDFGIDGGGAPSANVVGRSHIANLIKEAESLIGKVSYTMSGAQSIRPGGSGDCSSFTSQLLTRHGVAYPGRTTVDQLRTKIGKTIPWQETRPGDTVIYTLKGSSGYGGDGHTGIVYKKNWIIDLNAGQGTVGRNNFTLALGKYDIVGKRWYSDAVYEEYLRDQKGGGAPSRPPVVENSSRTYSVRTTGVVNAYSAPSGGKAIKRISNDEMFRSRSITPASIKIDENMFIRRGGRGLIVSELDNELAPIGIAVAKNRVQVYQDKSFSSGQVVEQGSDISLKPGDQVEVFEKQNGLLRINAPESNSWIPASSGYIDYTETVSNEFELSADFLSGQVVDYPLYSTVANRDLAFEDTGLKPMPKYTMAAREAIFPVGSVVEYKIPTRPDFNGTAVVVTNNVQDRRNVELFLEDEVDTTLFGKRDAKLQYVDYVEQGDINQYIQRELIKQKEVDDEIFS